jgi:hypothetical protein
MAEPPPSGLPVVTGGIDYTTSPGAGTLFQFGVHPALRSCGIGSVARYETVLTLMRKELQ